MLIQRKYPLAQRQRRGFSNPNEGQTNSTIATDAKGEPEQKDEFDVNKIKEILEYSALGEKDKITSLSFENGEIKGVIELAPNKLLSVKDLAVTSYSRASDALLDKEGWEVLTIEYVKVGNVSMKRSEKETNEYNMDYFPTTKIMERLK